MKFLKRFSWRHTFLREAERQAVEDILVEYHDIVARHRMDVGMNTEFRVQFTPKDDKVVCSQNPTMLIDLKEDLIVELALMHRDEIITLLPFSKYASPIFCTEKLNGKLRHLVDLRKINTLVTGDFTLSILPVSTFSDAGQHLTVKSRFARSTAPRLVTVCRWRFDGHWICLYSFLVAEFLLERDLH